MGIGDGVGQGFSGSSGDGQGVGEAVGDGVGVCLGSADVPTFFDVGEPITPNIRKAMQHAASKFFLIICPPRN